MQGTYSAKKHAIKRNWVLIDLKGQTLGRISTKIADILRGKNKPTFTPHVDTGDFVVAINASEIKFTGKKLVDKMYYRHSGYMGGLKETNAKRMMAKKPEELIRLTVKGMLPHNHLSLKILSKLKVYAGAEHPHDAQFKAN